MNYSLTVFRSIFDNKVDARFDYDSWEKFESVLYALSKKPGYKAKRGERTNAASPLISPAIYAENSKRLNSNVTAWAGWAALDVDNYTGSMEDITEKHGYYCVCYSTASSTKEKPKFRLVFPLTSHVPAEKIKHFWFALNKEFGSVSDAQTKDLSRMYYVPAVYPNAFNFIFTVKGKILNPEEIMAKHEYREPTNTFLDKLPKNIQDAILKSRRDEMTNTSIRWGSYRDCPFVSKDLVKQYQSIAGTDGSGRYRMIYSIMTSIACKAIRKKYPISAGQIAELVRQLDADTSRIYQTRNLRNEAERAIAFAYRSASG